MFGNIIIIIVGINIILIIAFYFLVAKSHKKVAQGKALVRTGMGGAKVALDIGMFVIPVLHKVEEMDISLKAVKIECLNKNGLICKDNLRADIKVTFYVRVNKDRMDIMEVAQTIGCEQASTQATLDSLFIAKFTEALRTTATDFNFDDLRNNFNDFKNQVFEIIGTDLNGYILDDCATEYLEQTSIEVLDPNHITDAKAIKKIRKITAAEKIEANKIILEQERMIKEHNLAAREAMLLLEKEEAKREAQHMAELDQINAYKNKSDSIYDRL